MTTFSSKPTNRLYQTNDYSIISKYSAVKKGYYQDDLLVQFVETYLLNPASRSPVVNYGYAMRSTITKETVCNEIRGASTITLVLGAGYDMLALNMINNSPRSQNVWIEIDLPEVVELKSRFIMENNVFHDRSDILTKRASTGSYDIYSTKSDSYHLVAIDMRNVEKFSACLNLILKNLERTNNREFLILNEVCLCYSSVGDINYILDTIFAAIYNFQHDPATKVTYLGLEQVRIFNRPTLMSNLMIKHFESLGHPLKHFPTPDDLKRIFSFQRTGSHVKIDCLAKNEFIKMVPLQEPFDEFEELYAYLSHYAIVSAKMTLGNLIASSTCKNSTSHIPNEMSNRSELSIGKISYIKSKLSRYGHANCLLNGCDKDDEIRKIFVTGGFGTSESDLGDKQPQQHKRLADCKILIRSHSDESVIDSYNLETNDLTEAGISLDRMRGQVVNLCDSSRSGSLIFFSGGRQNPSKRRNGIYSFIANIDEEGKSLSLRHKFDSVKFDKTHRWRHRLSEMFGDSCFQIGGMSHPVTIESGESESAIIRWNFSPDKLGFEYVNNEAISKQMHLDETFDCAFRDENSVLIYSSVSLKKHRSHLETPLLLDLRSNTFQEVKIRSKNWRPTFDSHLYFMDDCKVLKIGGVDLSTGYQGTYVELLDLRNFSLTVLEDEFSTPEAEKYFTMLTNSTSCHIKDKKEIITTGGGGNYFTFGTRFNRSHMVYNYSI